MWAVVTIPPREAMAEALIASLGEPALEVLDVRGDVQANHIRAWREVCAFPGRWVGVIQDDAVLCDDFAAKVRRRLGEAEELGFQAISLYSAAHLEPYLEPAGARWRRVDLRRMPPIHRAEAGGQILRSALPGEQCVLLRRDLAVHYGEFARRHADLYRRFPGVHDAILGSFVNARLGGAADLQSSGASQLYIAYPNLVDHRTDVASSLAHPTHARPRSSASFSRAAS